MVDFTLQAPQNGEQSVSAQINTVGSLPKRLFIRVEVNLND